MVGWLGGWEWRKGDVKTVLMVPEPLDVDMEIGGEFLVKGRRGGFHRKIRQGRWTFRDERGDRSDQG